MEEIDWLKFKTHTEKEFESYMIEKCLGFQIQKDTKWNLGLTKDEIASLEQIFGFKFPSDYVEMLKAFNGFKTLEISIDPEGKDEPEFERICYKYPDDIEKTKWLIDEVNQNIESANEVLEEAGFDSSQIEGFVPLYAHRVLVVLKNKQQSPVLSIWGNDIVVYGDSLIKYWSKEFNSDFVI